MGSEGVTRQKDSAAGGDDLVTRFVAAVSRYDGEALRALCAPHLRRWFSIGEEETGLEEMLAAIGRERSVVAQAEFVERHRTETAEGAVVMLTVDGTTKGGASFHIPVCLVLQTDGHRIHRIDEYANLEGAKGLLKEMFAP